MNVDKNSICKDLFLNSQVHKKVTFKLLKTGSYKFAEAN